MAAGRRPLPTALKLIKGNPGKRALPKREPRSPKGMPPCPNFLTPRGKKAWRSIGRHLTAMGVMTHADQLALALLADACADWLDANALIQEQGMTYSSETKDGGTITRPNPAVAIRDSAWKRIRLMAVEFGLTPAARAKVQAVPDDDVDPLSAFLGGARQA